MKKTILVLFMLLSISYISQAQVFYNNHSTDIKIKKNNGEILADVVVKLEEVFTQVNYQLLSGIDIDGEAIKQSGYIKNKVHKFKDVPEGKYLIKIIDKEKRMALFPIEIIGE